MQLVEVHAAACVASPEIHDHTLHYVQWGIGGLFQKCGRETEQADGFIDRKFKRLASKHFCFLRFIFVIARQLECWFNFLWGRIKKSNMFSIYIPCVCFILKMNAHVLDNFLENRFVDLLFIKLSYLLQLFKIFLISVSEMYLLNFFPISERVG